MLSAHKFYLYYNPKRSLSEAEIERKTEKFRLKFYLLLKEGNGIIP